MTRSRLRALALLATIAIVLAACVQSTAPDPTPTIGLSIGAPVEGQSLAGTVIALAGGIGGSAQDLAFTLGDVTVDAETNGTAIFDTRTLVDGAYTLVASGQVDGQAVTASVAVTVGNDLPDSGLVGPEGGTLESSLGSYATLPPGALDSTATLTLSDTSQAQILADFGVDYPALGVTFLGSLTVDAAGTSSSRSNLPVQVDLAGWAAAVQPGQDVVMFNVVPDADGDGIGELTFAATALATPNGSVVTLPTPRTEAYGPSAGAGSLRLQQTASVRPGELVALQGRGLNPQGALGNTAEFTSGAEILVLPRNLESGVVGPLQEIVLAVPAVGAGPRDLILRNATTGFESDAVSLQVGSLGSGSQATWDGFVAQVAAALGSLTGDDPDLSSLGSSLLANLGGDATLWAMVANSGLVDPANLALLETITANALSDAQRELVGRHALLLDALAVSEPELAASGADLASLLMLTGSPILAAPAGDIRAQQTAGSGCSAPSAPIVWGSPTGMGSAPPGSCAGGSGGGSGGGSALRSQRLGDSIGPVSGAVVRALAPGTADKIAPFTDVTDDAGYYYLPFLPPGEPVTIQGIDPATGRVAEFTTTTNFAGQAITAPLVFVDAGGGPGAPTASFTATPDPSGPVGSFLFDASGSSDPDGSIVEYLWSYGDGIDVDDGDPFSDHTYVTAGTFTVRLTVVDDTGEVGTTTVTLPELVKVSDVIIATGDETGKKALPSLAVPPALSADGRFVVFLANGTDLTGTGAFDGGRMMLYRNDLDAGIVEIVSVDDAGDPANPLEYLDLPSGLGVSADANLIAFASEDALVATDQDALSDVYIRDMTTGEVRFVAVAPGGADPSEPALSPSLSDDGTVLASFIGRAQYVSDTAIITVTDLVSGDVTNITAGSPAQPVAPILSGDGAYVFYIDGLGNVLTRVELATLSAERVSETAAGVPIDLESRVIGEYSVSRNGRYVSFVAYGICPTGSYCLVRKDMDTGEIVVAAETANDGSFYVLRPSSISVDGRWIAFLAEGALALDGSYMRRGFVWDATTGAYEIFDLNQLGVEPDNDTRSEYVTLSSDGAFIAFPSDAKNYVPTIDPYPLAPFYRTNNPTWEAP